MPGSPSTRSTRWTTSSAPSTRGKRPSALSAGASEVVLESNDVVLAEVFAVLDLHEYKIAGAGVLDAMRRAGGNVERGSRLDPVDRPIERHDPLTVHDEPVLGAPR